MRKLILISAALIGALAVVGIVRAISSTSSHAAATHRLVPSPGRFTTDVKIRITSNLAHRQGDAYTVRVGCAPLAASGVFWTAACREIAASPSAFTATYVDAACFGGLTTISLRITGQVNGQPVDIRQSGMCGPASIWRWWHLLYHYRSSLDLPAWVVHGQL